METLYPIKIYIPKNTHQDNNTRKWQYIVYILLQNNAIKVGQKIQYLDNDKICKAFVVKKLSDGWIHLDVRKKGNKNG